MNQRQFDKRYRLTPADEQLIWRLRTEKQMSQMEISDELCGRVAQSTISRCLQKMIQKYNQEQGDI